ncbi:MAG: DM13 domain-containing protein [Chloroflexi bacterium]|nr:DM13 domain-containing protein [Chloroflexota bacterium]
MVNRLRLLLVGIGGLIVVMIYTFPLWQPVLLREEVVENVPGLPEDLQPAFRQLPPDQQAAYRQMAAQNTDMAAQMLQAAISPDKVVPEAEQAMPQMTNEVVVAEGEFQAADTLRQITGTYKLYQLPDNRRVLRLEEFRVTNGPDLHVILSRSVNPKTGAEVGSDYIDLGLLQGNVGSQNYAVPAEVDLEAYQSVVIYNVSFTTVFGSAPLVVQ